MHAGRFFTFDVLDSHGGEIRAIAFNAEADRFEPVVAVGDIVDISKASLKPKRNNVRTVMAISPRRVSLSPVGGTLSLEGMRKASRAVCIEDNFEFSL